MKQIFNLILLIIFIWASLAFIVFGLSGCALKLYPVNIDERNRKAISDTARENFVEGMVFGSQLEKMLSAPQDEIPNLPNENPYLNEEEKGAPGL